MPTLAAVWSQVEALLSEGFSLIAVRDKDSGEFRAKSPYRDWKEFQTRIIDKAELWEQMNRHDTTAVAVICGRVSGNLEVIDIDIKNKAGIDAKVFEAIRAIYPDLFERLRLHRTPSGGFHIPYRIADQHPEKNQKLATREATDEEKARNPKEKQKAFIETRGEGGYVLLPPSLGYSLYKARDFPVITWSERCSLINMCKGFTEVIKQDKKEAANNKDNDYYDENPFQHFNNSEAAGRVLEQHGWNISKDAGDFVWYSRPGGSTRSVHAAFIKPKALYYFFSTNTDFEPDRCYRPSTVLATLAFDGNFKRLHKYLVSQGYGKIKESYEKRLVEKSTLANKELPANISQEAKDSVSRARAEVQERYPHGVFWELDGERFKIDRLGLYTVSEKLGFMYHNGDVVQSVGSLLYRRPNRFYFDAIRDYIREEDMETYRTLVNTYEAFVQGAGDFTITRLPLLDLDSVLSDTANECWKFYSNCALRITANAVEQVEYSNINKLIWSDKIQDREYITGPEQGLYLDFLQKATELTDHVRKCIGYLAHDYKDESTAYIIVLTEQVPDPKHGGGSGKNIFCNLFKKTTTVSHKAGAQVKYDEKFMQSWRGERLLVISDVPKNFDFLFLKELSSGSGILKKLFRDEIALAVSEMPKFVISTNYSYEVSDGGLRRRIVPIEFTNFFTRSGGVDVHYGGRLFPDDWSADDWIGFDAVIVSSVQLWMQSGRKLISPELSGGGWRKQFEQTYGHYTAEFIYEYWDVWTSMQYVPLADFKKHMSDFFEERNVHRNYQPSSFKVNAAISEYAKKQGIYFHESVNKRVNTIVTKCKLFSNDETPF